MLLFTEPDIFLFPPSCGAASFFGDKSILTKIVVFLFMLLLLCCLNLVPSYHILQQIHFFSPSQNPMYSF